MPELNEAVVRELSETEIEAVTGGVEGSGTGFAPQLPVEGSGTGVPAPVHSSGTG